MVALRATSGVIVGAISMGLVPWLVSRSALSALALAAGRIAVAAIGLFVWLLARGTLGSVRGLLAGRPFACAALALCHGLTVLCYFFAAKRISPALAAMLLFSGSVYLVPLSAWIFGDAVSWRRGFAAGLAALGLMALFGGQAWHGPGIGAGHLIGAASGLLMASVYLFARALSRPRGDWSPPSDLGATLAAVQHLLALPYAAFWVDATVLQAEALWLLPLIGLGCTALPFAMIFGASRTLPGGQIGLLLLFEPLTPLTIGLVGGTLDLARHELAAMATLLFAALLSLGRPAGRGPLSE